MKLFIKALFILLPFVAIGQNKTYLGLEIGPKYEVYQYTDNGNGLYTKPAFFSPIYGLTIGQELNKTFIFETGFYLNDYGESYRIRGDIGYRTSNAILAYQIPLRLKARLNLIEDKLSIVSTIGYTLAINSDFGSSGTGSSFSSTTGSPSNDSTRIEDVSNYSLQRSYGLLETGVGLEYQFPNSLTLSLSANYMTGFKKVVDIDVRYWINDGPEQSASVFSNGDYFSMVFGVKYPISRIWAK